MIYSIVLILILMMAVWNGWRKGMVYQIASLLGLGFGIVAARIFSDSLAPHVESWLPVAADSATPGMTPVREYMVELVSASVIFAGVYLAFRIFAGLLNSALQLLHMGAINSIVGAAFCFCKWVLLMSIALNLWMGINPKSGLLKPCTDGDGNIIELVMAVAPALLNTISPDELEHSIRVEQARSLEASNIWPGRGVEYESVNNLQTVV